MIVLPIPNILPAVEVRALEIDIEYWQHWKFKDHYEQIFIEAAESIRAAVEKFKPQNPCTTCAIKDCKIEKKDVFTDYPIGCAYKRRCQCQAILDSVVVR